MAFLNLSTFLGKPKICFLRCLIGRQQTEDTHLIADEQGTATLVATQQFQKGRKHIQQGTFVRIIFPSLSSTDNKVLLDERSIVVPCSPFVAVDFPIVAISEDSGEKKGTSIKLAATFSPGSIVSMILVKVVHIGATRAIQSGSKVTRLTIKDSEGNKNYLSVWNKKRDLFEVDKVYQIRNLKVENFPPNEEKKYLSTMQNTSVLEETDNIDIFENISVADAKVEGVCVGVTQFYFYLSCPSCSKKISDNTNVCSSCKEEFQFSTDDYKAEILLSEGEEVKTYVVFKSKINTVMEAPNVVHETSSEVESRVNEGLMDKKLLLEVTEKASGDPVVQKISFSL